jgi:hypothetical protein
MTALELMFAYTNGEMPDSGEITVVKALNQNNQQNIT